MRRVVVSFALLASLLLPPQARAEDSHPVCRNFIENTREKALAILHSSASFPQKHEALVTMLENALDMHWITEQVAGAYRRNASESERRAYDKVYRTYLSEFYIGGFDENDLNNIMDVTFIKFKQLDTNTYLSRVEITQKNDDPIVVEMELAEAPVGICHIRDFKAEGVSMLDSQREEIQSLGAKGGLPFITEKLSSRPH